MQLGAWYGRPHQCGLAVFIDAVNGEGVLGEIDADVDNAQGRPLPSELMRVRTEIARMLIHGKCHCGNISFFLTWEPDPAEIPARACTCSFCTKHGGVWTSNPSGALEVLVREPSLVSRYAFGTRSAEFHTCARCGIVPVVTSRIDDHLYAVVSVNAFESVDQSLLRRASASFDGEGKESRLARRKRNWIASVEYIEGGN